MFERFERELLPKERRLLSRELQHWRRMRRKSFGEALLWWIVCSVVLGGLGLLVGRPMPKADARWFYPGFIGVLLLPFLWDALRTRRGAAERIALLEEALSGNRASVARIATEQMVEFEEIEDEGACYAFQAAPDKIVFIVGQDFYGSAKFPNSDFEIVDVPSSRGYAVYGCIEKRGQKLAPVRKIKADIKKTLEIPDHLATMEGKLDNVEDLLRPQDQR